MATGDDFRAILKEDSSKESSNDIHPDIKEAISQARKDIASTGRTIAGSLIGAVPDLSLIPSQLKAAYKGKEGPKTYSQKAREWIDTQTGNYTKPKEGLGQIGLEIGSDVLSGMLTGSSLLKGGAKLAAMGAKYNPQIASKASQILSKGSDLSKISDIKNVAGAGAGTAGGMGASSLLNNLSPLKEGEEPSTLRSVANIAVPLLGGAPSGAIGYKAAQRMTLTPKQKRALKITRLSESVPKWNEKLKIDTDQLNKDRKLGIEGTLGTYSERPWITMHEYQHRKNPSTDSIYSSLDKKNLETYKKHLGMDRPGFESLDPNAGGELLQLGLGRRKEGQVKRFEKEYKQIKNKVPVESVIPEKHIKGKVGEHIFEELEKLTPSEKAARMKELSSVDFLERLGKASGDVTPVKSKVSISPVQQAIDTGQLSSNHIMVDSMLKLPISQQSMLLKEIGITLPKMSASSSSASLRDLLGPTQYYSLSSIKDAVGKKTRPHFGQISDKDIGGNKALYAQLKNTENNYLRESFPDLFKQKKKIDAEYKSFKRTEAPIINQLLGSEEKPLTEAQTFGKVMSGVHQKPELLTLGRNELNPSDQYTLTQALLKGRVRKSPQGDAVPTSATGYAQSFAKLTPTTQEVILQGIPKNQQKAFLGATESILKKKGLERLENNSGTAHHTEYKSLLGRGFNAIADIRKGELKPLIHFLSGDLLFPKWQAQKIFTNQAFLKNLDRFNKAKNFQESIKYGKALQENMSFKNAMKSALMRNPIHETETEIIYEPKIGTGNDFRNILKENRD